MTDDVLAVVITRNYGLPFTIADGVRKHLAEVFDAEEALWYEADGPKGQAARETLDHLRAALLTGSGPVDEKTGRVGA